MMIQKWFIVTMVLAVLATSAQAVNIETVPVGNLGNANDTHGDGYGGVDYAYSIGKYEVTAGQYCEFLNAVAKTDAYGLYNSYMDSDSWGCQITRHGNSGNYTYDFSGGTVEAPGSTATDWANRPVSNVSWGDAARFANWLHNGQPTGTLTGNPVEDAGLTEVGAYDLNGVISDAALLAVNREIDWKWSLPSEDEWYKAAYHKNDGDTGNYFDYPTSSNTMPSNYLTTPDDGNNATYSGLGYTIGSPYWRTEVGAHENSDSPYGTFDQGGNVFEWNGTVISNSYGSYRGLRGSGHSDQPFFMAAFLQHYDSPAREHHALGFRVVQVPEPGSITLLLCGLLAGLIWWRRGR